MHQRPYLINSAGLYSEHHDLNKFFAELDVSSAAERSVVVAKLNAANGWIHYGPVEIASARLIAENLEES